MYIGLRGGFQIQLLGKGHMYESIPKIKASCDHRRFEQASAFSNPIDKSSQQKPH
jgi:hypothetical protein